MLFDVVVLTDSRQLAFRADDWYSRQVHREDGLVLDALRDAGLTVCRLAWDDAGFDWRQARSLLFRTTWDYFERFGEFAPWLERASRQCRLFNAAELIRWNLDKRYLVELENKGVAIVPTRYIEKGERRSLAQLVDASGWQELILKPAVSGNARHTYRFDAGDAGRLECVFGELVEAESMLLQPFQRQVLEDGELSLMVVDGRFSHAIRKTPKSGDFRVQDDYGGSVHPHAASDEEIAFAEAAVRAVPFDVLYARVDLIRDDAGRLAIMELEMIEPELFFRFRPEAAGQLAAGLRRRLADGAA
ncbi:ATP-grasp domain-containing protein [Chromobacterium sp. CV08]|uniref:ATP-grasp domain-containing protein n=1 Tax=Chromobacterium sp. CV08 TaxID=3133274 RepID=UPI003DAA17F6